MTRGHTQTCEVFIWILVFEDFPSWWFTNFVLYVCHILHARRGGDLVSQVHTPFLPGMPGQIMIAESLRRSNQSEMFGTINLRDWYRKTFPERPFSWDHLLWKTIHLWKEDYRSIITENGTRDYWSWRLQFCGQWDEISSQVSHTCIRLDSNLLIC